MRWPSWPCRRRFAIACSVGFGIFIVLLLYRGDVSRCAEQQPGRVYLSFVLTSTNYLVLLMALLLSAFSLPNDVKNRTIYTVVTKPIRASEIVLGRTLGFAAVGTSMLLVMGIISYFFVTVVAGAMTMQIDAANVSEETGKDGKVSAPRMAKRRIDHHHRHTFEVDAERQRPHQHGAGALARGRAAGRRQISRRAAARALDRQGPHLWRA